MAYSSSLSLEQLSSLLAELSAELQSVVLTHHEALLSINSHILLIEGEVDTVLKRVNSLRAALARIQQALMQPYEHVRTGLQQLVAMQDTAEHIRQAIRVLHACEKLRQLMTSHAHTAAAHSSIASPAASSPSSGALTPRLSAVGSPAAGMGVGVPALRDLVKCASLLYDVQQVFALVNLNGVAAVDAQMPFLNAVAETLHNSGRRILHEALRGAGGAGGGPTPGSGAVAAGSPPINQLDVNYVVQLFYNLAPNPHAEATLRALQPPARSGGERRRAVEAQGASAEEDEAINEASACEVGGGVELVLVLDELVSAYLEQARAALRKILDIAASAHALNLQEAAKRSKAGSRKSAAGTAAAPASTATPAPTPASLRSTLWDRLDSFSELLFGLSMQVWTVGKILHEKRDLVTNAAPGVSFATLYRTQRALLRARQARERREAERNGTASAKSNGVADSAGADERGEVTLLHTFWRGLCELLRSEFDPIASSADAASSSASLSSAAPAAHSSHNFLRTIFVNEYPRLHQLFDRGVVERIGKYAQGHALSAATANHALVTGGGAHGGPGTPTSAGSAVAAMASFAATSGADTEPPPTLGADDRQQLLSSFLPFFQLYLSRSLSQLSEPITQMFTAHEHSGAHATVPSRSDVGAFLSVLASALDSAAEVRDPEVQRLQCRAIQKSVQLFVQHAERMLVTEQDRDMFSSAHMPTSLQVDGYPAAQAQAGSMHKSNSSHGGSSGLSSAASASSMMSQVQRNNLDVFAILLQLERELTEAELQRKYPALFGGRAAAGMVVPASSAGGSAAAATSSSSWSSSTPSSPALATLRQCWQSVRALQREALSVLLHHTSLNLSSSFAALVTELDAEPGAPPAVQAAAQAFAAAAPPPDGSPAMLSFRRRLLYCLHVLFPLYTHMLASTPPSSNAAPAHLPAVDVACRAALWHSALVAPLHASLCTDFLHAVSLVPLSTAQAPTVLSEPLRAHHTSMSALFKSLMQQLHPQAKRSSRMASSAAQAGDVAAAHDVHAIDGIHAWKELLQSRDGSDYLHFHSSRALDSLTLLHFLLANCSLRLQSPSSDATVGVPHSAPHRLLQLRVEEYLSRVREYNPMEVMDMANQVYSLLESRIPSIPKGPEGRTFLREHYPNLALALKLITKHG